MKQDPGSNYNMAEVFAAASQAADTVYTASVDHSKLPSVSYVVSCGTFATSLAFTVQVSDDNLAWTDEPDTKAGNDITKSLAAAGDLVVNVPNPRKRFSRLKIVAGGTCVFAVVAVAGPKLYVEPADTTI